MFGINIVWCIMYLDVSDPHNTRKVRSVLTQSEYKEHVNRQALFISSLGNAQMDSSLPYYESFLNSSESHLHHRCSAVEALKQYHHLQVIDTYCTFVHTVTCFKIICSERWNFCQVSISLEILWQYMV